MNGRAPQGREALAEAGVGFDSELILKPLGEVAEALNGLVPVVLAKMCFDQRFCGGFAQRLGGKRS